MYDFYYGSKEEILADPLAFLLGVKRTLPRWLNGLPDLEFMTLIRLIETYAPKEEPVFLETGVGSSTLVFLYYAMMRNGRVISWDTSNEKASYVRSVCVDSIEKSMKLPACNRWTFVNSMSLAPHTGMGLLGELADHIDMTHHDSDHTWSTVSGEISAALPYLADGAIVCVDDVHHRYSHTYEPIININRKKLGLLPINPLPDNLGEPHSARIPDFLGGSFGTVEPVTVDYANEGADGDIYYQWYSHDRKQMNKFGLDPLEKRQERFAAWRVSSRKG
jgi:hypothetical protein